MTKHTLDLTDREIESIVNALSDALERTRDKGTSADTAARIAAFRKMHALVAGSVIFVPTEATLKWVERLRPAEEPNAQATA